VCYHHTFGAIFSSFLYLTSFSGNKHLRLKKNGTHSGGKVHRLACRGSSENGNTCKWTASLKKSQDKAGKVHFKFSQWTKYNHSCVERVNAKVEYMPSNLNVVFGSLTEAKSAIIKECAENHQEVKKNGKSSTSNQIMTCKRKNCKFRCHIHKSAEKVFIVKRWQDHTCHHLDRSEVLRKFTTIPTKLKEHLRSLALNASMRDVKNSVLTFTEQNGLKTTWSEDNIATYVNALRKQRNDIGDTFLELYKKLSGLEGITLRSVNDEHGRPIRMFIVFKSMDKVFECFGAVVSFDATYGKNKYGYPVHFFVSPSNENSSFIICAAVTQSETSGPEFFLFHFSSLHAYA